MTSTSAYSQGWIAVLDEIDDGHWINPTEATKITSVPAQRLRAWAEQGVISRIHQPGQQYRYLGEELVACVGIAFGGRPTLPMLKRYIDDRLRAAAASSKATQ